MTRTRRYGYARYRVGFSSGIPVEFLVQWPVPKDMKREWNAMFAEAVAKALQHWVKLNGGPE